MNSDDFERALLAHGMRPQNTTIVGIENHQNMRGCSVMVESDAPKGTLGVYFAERSAAEEVVERFTGRHETTATPGDNWQP